MQIEQREVMVSTPDGEMPAFSCTPTATHPKPGIMLLMEAFGLTQHIKDVAVRLANEGYVVVAPDLYYRELPNNTFEYDQVESAKAMMSRLNFEKTMLEDIRATLAYIKSRADVYAERIGVTGFCFGGSMTFYTATRFSSEIAAAAPFYSVVLDEWLAAVTDITIPVYLFFGGADSFIPLERIRQIDSRFRELHKAYQLTVYPDAEHGFFCHERSSYNCVAAEDSWQELTRFFSKHLQLAIK